MKIIKNAFLAIILLLAAGMEVRSFQEVLEDSCEDASLQDLPGLMCHIKGNKNLIRLYDYVKINTGEDPGHDLTHFLRVALWGIRFSEGKIEPKLIIAAALLHDIINIPKDSPNRKEASKLSADHARKILGGYGYTREEIETIADAIHDHSYSRGVKPRSFLGKVLQDADRMDALGALGILRLVSTGTRMNSIYFDKNDPWAENRKLDGVHKMVDHFFEKIFKLPSKMNTKAAREAASQRLNIMIMFLRDLGDEIGKPLPPRMLQVTLEGGKSEKS